MTHYLDVKGSTCPIPIMKMQQKLRHIGKGDLLEVVATDPATVADFRSLADMGTVSMLEHSMTDGVFRFLLRKET